MSLKSFLIKCFENFEICSKVALGQENSIYYAYFHKCQGFIMLDFVILTKKHVIQKVLSKYMYISLPLSHRH